MRPVKFVLKTSSSNVQILEKVKMKKRETKIKKMKSLKITKKSKRRKEMSKIHQMKVKMMVFQSMT